MRDSASSKNGTGGTRGRRVVRRNSRGRTGLWWMAGVRTRGRSHVVSTLALRTWWKALAVTETVRLARWAGLKMPQSGAYCFWRKRRLRSLFAELSILRRFLIKMRRIEKRLAAQVVTSLADGRGSVGAAIPWLHRTAASRTDL